MKRYDVLILSFLCSLVLATPIFGQWELECTATDSPQWLYLNDTETVRLYEITETQILVHHPGCQEPVQFTYNFTADEQNPDYKSISVVPDLNDNGYAEIVLYYTNGSGRGAFRLFDITTNETLFERSSTESSQFTHVTDWDRDGILECVVSIYDPLTNNTTEEFYSTGVPVASTGGSRPDIGANFELHQNYPNPFNGQTTIKYSVPMDGLVQLEISNILGQAVNIVNVGWQTEGYHQYALDVGDISSRGLGSGPLFYRVSVNGQFSEAKQMQFLK